MVQNCNCTVSVYKIFCIILGLLWDASQNMFSNGAFQIIWKNRIVSSHTIVCFERFYRILFHLA